jgi:hypothetical protein
MADDQRPSGLYATLVERHFERSLVPNTRPTNRERALEMLLVAVIRAGVYHGADDPPTEVRVDRAAMFDADESGLTVAHRYDRDRNEHVVYLTAQAPDPRPEDPDPDFTGKGDGDDA